MKNLYVLFLFVCFGAFAQNVTITKIIETGCPSDTGFLKTVELYVDGTVDFSSEVTLNYMQNGAPWADNQIDVTPFGVQSDTFIYIVRDISVMQNEFPSTTFDASNTIEVGTSTNGDDGYQVVLNGEVVSQFGKTETDADDDTESNWQHSDAVATRLNALPDLGTWDPTHWNITPENDLDDHTACEGSVASANLETYFGTLGDTFPLGTGSGWTPTADVCTTIFGNTITTFCNTFTNGSTDDFYTATIDFSNAESGNTFVLTTTEGTIDLDASDDPNLVDSGTIVVVIEEGTDAFVSMSDLADGGNCDLSVDITSPGCVSLVLNEALFDPPSDDDETDEVEGDANNDGIRDNLEDEFIEFFNNSDTELDVSGYTIYDANALSSDTPRHVVPDNTIIPANGAFVVFGGGTPTGSFGTAIVQTASGGELNLTNSGDVITVKNNLGQNVIEFNSSDFALDFGENQSITRSPDITGNYVLHLDANASLVYSPGLEVDGSTLSVEDVILDTELVLYPIPVINGMLNINTELQIDSIKIYDITGVEVFSKDTIQGQSINLNALNSGAYIIRIASGNKTLNKKIIIK